MDLEKILQDQRAFFHSNATKSILFRKEQLTKLKDAILSNQEEIELALKQDLNKSAFETYLTEVSMVVSEITNSIKQLHRWCKPQKKKTPLSHFPGKSYTIREPFGSVLVLSPWNYPFQLALSPVVGAMAAGNCVILKSSKNSIHTTKIIQKMIRDTFEEKYICCVDIEEEYENILSHKYDYIFFTGSERVGKLVMKAAGEYVTPLSLELGGKSPCIIDKNVNIELAAKRILWGKLLNAGQTCVAPDYVLVHNQVKDDLIKYMRAYIEKMFPKGILEEDYPKIINAYHFERLSGMIDREGAKIGGRRNSETNKIELTLFIDASFDSEVMQEEIFGPIIPLIAYDKIEWAISKVKERAKPLACYLFSEDNQWIQKMLHEISFGGGCINDTVMHLANHHLPFGGVGSSGMGNYHGDYSFDTFSHEKSIFKSSTHFDIPLRYAPYQEDKLSLIKKIMK